MEGDRVRKMPKIQCIKIIVDCKFLIEDKLDTVMPIYKLYHGCITVFLTMGSPKQGCLGQRIALISLI